MKKRSFFIAAVLLLVLILPAAAVLGLDVVSRRGHPTLDASIERLALEEGCFSMTASLNESSGDTFRRAVWQIEEDTLYVTLFIGLARSDFARDSLELAFEDGALRDVQQVCLRADSAARLIYSR
ncbi:MAG: hypothetical protein HFG00_07100 [Oscillibacter sp.]|nr:hypothetical protein [Oscillibacter sp.]